MRYGRERTHSGMLAMKVKNKKELSLRYGRERTHSGMLAMRSKE